MMHEIILHDKKINIDNSLYVEDTTGLINTTYEFGEVFSIYF
jgi:hypothetical protein